MNIRTAKQPDRLTQADLPEGLCAIAARAGTLEDLIAANDRAAAEEARAYRHSAEYAEAWLADLGVPWQTRRPTWKRVPTHLRGLAEAYIRNLDAHLKAGEGVAIAGQLGAGKTCLCNLMALAAHHRGYTLGYVLAGWKLVEMIQAKTPPPRPHILILDDLDYVSSARQWDEAESWQRIGQWLYEWDAGPGVLWLGANVAYATVTGHVGMERAASRLQQRIPEGLRWETSAGDQRTTLQMKEGV